MCRLPWSPPASAWEEWLSPWSGKRDKDRPSLCSLGSPVPSLTWQPEQSSSLQSSVMSSGFMGHCDICVRRSGLDWPAVASRLPLSTSVGLCTVSVSLAATTGRVRDRWLFVWNSPSFKWTYIFKCIFQLEKKFLKRPILLVPNTFKTIKLICC